MEITPDNTPTSPDQMRSPYLDQVSSASEFKTNWLRELRVFAIIFIPLALILGLVMWSFNHLENLEWLATQEEKEHQRLVLEKSLISREFQAVVSDILYLSGQGLIREFIKDPQGCDLVTLKRDLLLFAREKKTYDQVRVLDPQGREKIRISYMAGRPEAMPDMQLQEKGGRYYFDEAKKLNPGQIYVSPFDLNMEHGQIEVPFKPTIRFATPLFDHQGNKQGLIILNYLGMRLIDSLKRSHTLALGYVMLLNQDGYWLFGANQDHPEWGFMFMDGKDWSLKKAYPQVWKRLEQSNSGQFYDQLGLITFVTVAPALEAQLAVAGRLDSNNDNANPSRYPHHWKLISVIPQPVLDEARGDLRSVFTYIYLLLLGILVVGAAFISRVYEIRLATRQALLRSNDSLNITVRRLTKRNRQVVLVNRLGDLLQSCDTVQETFGIISHFGQELFPEDSGQICLSDIEDDGRTLNPVASWGNLGPQPAFAEEDCWALRRGKVHVLERAGAGPVCPHFPAPLKAGSICIPMMAHGAVMGLMSLCVDPALANKSEVEQENSLAARQRLAVTMADLIALSISNITLRETLREQSIRDALTGLYNRRYMEDSLSREASRAQRNQTPVSLIMMDVDHFKKFNDNYGHETGDKLLSELGRLLANHCRTEDIACRYGGEEFLLILPGADREIAMKRAELIRLAVENRLNIKDATGHALSATISAGVSCFPQDGDTPEAAVEAADSALYQAKRGGRNRVEVAESLPV